MAHVLIVTLGPIQDFIAAARRTRDFWFGSWLLSELSKATARGVAEACGLGALVFPGVEKAEELEPASATSVANKIVVRVPEGIDPAAVARHGKESLEKRLAELRDEAYGKIDPRDFDIERAKEQVGDLIEYSWVSAAEQGTNGYGKARQEAEALLAARKNTRLWGKVTWGDEVPKSSIDGERESVLHERIFDQRRDDPLTPEQIRRMYGVGPAERLCGVGLLKRHGTREGAKYAHRFLSTGHLAAWPLYRRLKETPFPPDLEEAWAAYLDSLERGGVELREQRIVQGDGWNQKLFEMYDGSLLFEGRLPELFEEIADDKRREAASRESRAALNRFLEKTGVKTPLPYYAILRADGDHMGKAIEGQKTVEDHQKLSRALDQFAQRARTIVEGDHSGELVYSGGDDVLALVPLDRAVRCARQLAKTFGEHLSDFPEPPALSAGIGVSHFMEPLTRALELAGEAEKLAKVKRNSLAVKVDKRSGPPVEVTGTWGDLDARLDAYVEMHRNDWVPDGAAYELRELGRLLDNAEEAQRSALEELVKKEAERILRRKRSEHGAKEEVEPASLARLLADVEALPLHEVADGLIVARLLEQALEEAKPRKPEAGT